MNNVVTKGMSQRNTGTEEPQTSVQELSLMLDGDRPHLQEARCCQAEFGEDQREQDAFQIMPLPSSADLRANRWEGMEIRREFAAMEYYTARNS